jgi:hypothetical protein
MHSDFSLALAKAHDTLFSVDIPWGEKLFHRDSHEGIGDWRRRLHAQGLG